MKKILLSILILCSSLLSYGTDNQTNSSANGTIINGRYVLEDFDGSPSPTLTSSKTANLTATIATHPANSTQAAKVVSTGYGGDVYFTFNVTLPTGKTLSDCDSLFFDLYVSSASYKKLRIYINSTMVHEYATSLLNGTNSDKGTQKIKFSDFNKSGAAAVVSGAGNSFTLGFGNDQGSATYYIDNVMLHGNLVISTNTDFLESKLITYSANHICLKEKGNIQLLDLGGHVVLSRENVSNVDITDISSGVYIVKATVNGKQIVKKILKNKTL